MKTPKTLFTAVGTIMIEDQKKKLRLNSSQHWEHHINKLFPGKKYGITVSELTTSRSGQQLRLYWTLLGYLAEYSGHIPEELHEAIMRQKFGVKRIHIGDIVQDVRKSIADNARFPTSDMVELIDEVQKLCHKLGVVVPTKQELGYIL